jgi:hypothetical protein
MNNQRTLAIIIVLQTLTLLGQWAGTPSLTPVQAQIPDGGAQRAATIDELKSVNAKLDKLISILADGNLQVKVVQPDEKK